MRTTRLKAWKELAWKRSVIAIALLTLFLSRITFWWDQLFPNLSRPRLSTFIHAVHWWYWVIGGLVAILVLVMEGALRVVNQLEDQVEEYKRASYSPNITIVVHQISIMKHLIEPNTYRILTILSVRNTGAPSIVDTWSMTFDDYPTVKVEGTTFVEDFEWQYSDMRYTFSVEDHIHKKLAENPVPAGGKQVGFMVWKVQGVDLESIVKDTAKLPKVTITARDVNGTLITATDRADTRDDIGAYYAGLQGPQNRVKKQE